MLDDQLCDECQGARCGGKFAPFFCANVTCLQVSREFLSAKKTAHFSHKNNLTFSKLESYYWT